MKMLYFTKKSHYVCSIMSEQPIIKLLLVKIALLSKMLLHCVTPNSNTHTLIGMINITATQSHIKLEKERS